jgi:rare lipoprotein A
MVILNKNLNRTTQVLKPIQPIRVALLLTVLTILIAISAVAVRAAESSLRATPVKPTLGAAMAINSAAVATTQPVLPAPAPANVVAAHNTHVINMMSGNASWYGSVLQGHRTASGVIFDEHQLTAAHRTLPFGTMVRVTDLRSHRSVIVKITDRGVLFSDRAIDLSYAAASELGMVKDGVHPVRLTVVPKNDPSLAEWTAVPTGVPVSTQGRAE